MAVILEDDGSGIAEGISQPTQASPQYERTRHDHNEKAEPREATIRAHGGWLGVWRMLGSFHSSLHMAPALHGPSHCFLAFFNHRLRIAFFRHFGSPFTLLWHCIAWIHSLARTDCIAWVCGMGLMRYGVLHRKWRHLLDQTVTSFSVTYLASPPFIRLIGG